MIRWTMKDLRLRVVKTQAAVCGEIGVVIMDLLRDAKNGTDKAKRWTE
jgi:hypothetical protein